MTVSQKFPYKSPNVTAVYGLIRLLRQLSRKAEGKRLPLKMLVTKYCVCLAAWANRKKLKRFIIFAGAKHWTKSLDQKFKTKCAVRSLPNA